MNNIYSRPAKIRRASIRGKEVTIPPEAQLQIGDDVVVFYKEFVLIVPKGYKVDEELLLQAIKIDGPKDA